MKWLSGLRNKSRVESSIVIVTGLPRSGTSMVMRMLEAGGIAPLTDHQRRADADNPKGYYEFELVKKLREGDYSWVPQAQGSAVKVISALLAYLPDDFDYQVLFIRRAISEVLASQRRMLVHRGEDPDKVSDQEMTAFFEKHLLQVESWLASRENMRTLYLDYNRMLVDPQPQVKQINAFLDHRLSEDQMLAMIDPSLYRQREAPKISKS